MSSNTQARLGDECGGICECHLIPINVTGKISTSSNDFFVNGKGAARLTDKVEASCGHEGEIVTSATSFFVNGLPVARNTSDGETILGECPIMEIIEGSIDFYVE